MFEDWGKFREWADGLKAFKARWRELRWHWEGDRRTCNQCGGEVFILEEGSICSKCHRYREAESI